MEQEEQPIRTYSIEYSKQHYSKCTRCLKAIPKRSLRVATLVRKNKKEKKSKGTHQWSHFTCWKVPEELTKRPIEIFRGYPDLKEKDQIRVKKLISGGTGMTWKELQRQLVKKMEDEKAAKEEEKEANNYNHHYYNEEEEEEKVEEKKVNNHQHFYNDDEEEEEQQQQQIQKEELTKNKKNKKRKNMEDEEDDDIDMTSKLTGIQTTLPLSDKKQKQNQKQKQKQKKTKTDNNSNNNANNKKKINKKNQPKAQQEQEQKPSIKLSNSKDQIELESIAKEIRSTLLSK
ncbi:unnamed protein product [Cunninghamella echinulata]